MIPSRTEGIVMLRVVGCLTQSHDLGLVALACVVCVLATNATARLLTPSRDGAAPPRGVRRGAAIMAFAAGVWTTHFISILAYTPGVPFAFDVPIVVVSLALAFVGTTLAFMIAPCAGATQGEHALIVVVRGLILAAGVAAMHFVGMEALRMPTVLHYDPGLVAVALGAAALCATIAMWLLARRNPGTASLFLTLAVASTHFIAMGSLTLDPFKGAEVAALGISKPALAVATTATCLLIVVLAVVASILDHLHGKSLAKEVRRFRTLADATSEGIVFERDGRIADVNRAMCRLSGSDAATLIGLRLADLIPGLALLPRSAERPCEHLVLLPDGQTRPVELLWRDDADGIGHVLAIRDLSRQKAAESQIERLARFDSLTGLLNRDMFEEHLQKTLSPAGAVAGGVALLRIDLDRFDTVGETLGPRAAEQILVETARRLTSLTRDSDTVARLGRDDFAIIQRFAEPPAADQPAAEHPAAAAATLADRIVIELALPFRIDDHPVTLSASVGIALHAAGDTTAADLIKNAALARSQAKQDGHACWRWFEPDMHQRLQMKRSLEHDLLIALRENEFTLNYQPFVSTQTQNLAGYEALLRWDHPTRGRIPPGEFIPLAEECGLIVPIGNWVLATACAEAVTWADPVTISVNLSPAQFVEPGIVATVADVLHRTGLPAARLELEITEGTLMDDAHNALQILTALKALGVQIAMDDFGTGFSSLSYLRKFPFDKLKIDRSFISDTENEPDAQTIVQAIIAMGRSLRLHITAEGVETPQQLTMLRDQGCTFAQGYLIGRPQPADQLGQHVRKGRRDVNPPSRKRLSTAATVSPV
jgi:diguanylate cyclase (GGDEF)-like protein/PAS domain S-box-containing protein